MRKSGGGKERERDASAGTTRDTHGHTRASGKNTHTIKNMLYVDTPQTITHTHTLGPL